jgi:hypothetical protein
MEMYECLLQNAEAVELARRLRVFLQVEFKSRLTSNGGAGHPTTLLCTMAAHLSTALTMFRFVLLALGSTSIANVGTKPAEFCGEMRTATHEAGGHPTDLGAIAVQADAFRHHLDVFFAQASGCTMLAFLSALYAGFDARSESFMRHGCLLW